MVAARDVRNKIGSIKNTKKITKAMELVAASKMRRVQQQMERSKPYANKMRKVVLHISQSHTEYTHHYLITKKDIKRVGLIVVSTDRGLCGSLNINLFKETIRQMKQWRDQSIEVDLCIIGQKALSFFRRFGANIVSVSEKISDSPRVTDLIGVVKVMLDAYDDGNIHELYIGTNEFINTMTQRPYIEKLLPIDQEAVAADQAEEETQKGYWDYLYEPEARSLLDFIFKRYIESLVYQSVVENIACEQAARMIAMKNASDNADEFISDLQLLYNKARQAAITQEITEIVSGSEALI